VCRKLLSNTTGYRPYRGYESRRLVLARYVHNTKNTILNDICHVSFLVFRLLHMSVIIFTKKISYKNNRWGEVSDKINKPLLRTTPTRNELQKK